MSKMGESGTWTHSNVEEKPKSTKKYCFGCLCVNEENNVQNYAFQCGPLKNIFQMDCISLCYLCKRMAQHTELFIQNVQSNQILLENIQNAMDNTLKSGCNQPLVNLTKVSFCVVVLAERDSSSSEETTVICSESESKDLQVKTEIKEEEYMENVEGEDINGGDEFTESYVKDEEDIFPLKHLVKVESELEDNDSMDLMNLSATLKKNKQNNKKKSKMKRNNLAEKNRDVTKVQKIYMTRQQCMEERANLKQDQKYLELAYKCGNCIKGFSFKGSYDKHMEKHNRCMGKYECDICKQRIQSEHRLVSHMRFHLIRYKCAECGLTRNCRMTIQDHYNSCHSQGQSSHICSFCSKTFKRQGYLRKHIQNTHSHKSPVQCAYCHKTYRDKAILRNHMVVKHSNEVSAAPVSKKYVCQECGMAFKAPSQLRNHSTKHSDSRDYYCVECDKSFKSGETLKTHLKTTAIHVSNLELPLPCLHCDKRFAIRRNLDRHTNRVHLNIKPPQLTCDKCDKIYLTSRSLKDHKRLAHEGYKRPLQFPCPMCDKVFDRKEILKGHIRTHTGERPYQCSKCPASFSQSNGLRTHDRLVHLKLTRDGRPKGK